MRRRLRELPNQPAILVAGLKHDGNALGAASFKIDDHANVARPRVAVGKRFRTQQTRLFAVGEQDDDIIAQGRRGFESAQSFEQHAHRVAVIRGSGTIRDGIVMPQQQDRFRVRRSRHARHDVVHARS